MKKVKVVSADAMKKVKRVNREGREIRKEAAEFALGTKALKRLTAKHAAKKPAAIAAAEKAAYPWIRPLNQHDGSEALGVGSEVVAFSTKKLVKTLALRASEDGDQTPKSALASTSKKAGLSKSKKVVASTSQLVVASTSQLVVASTSEVAVASASTPESTLASKVLDRAIGFSSVSNGDEVLGEFCTKCTAPMRKYVVGAEIPKPQQFNTVKYAKRCSNMLCTVPINVLDVTTEQVFNSMPDIDYNRPLHEIMKDPNIPEMSLEEALSRDFVKEHEEAVKLSNVCKFMIKEHNDAVGFLRRMYAMAQEKARAEEAEAKAGTGPGKKLDKLH